MAARAIVTTPSSIGWRSTSSSFLRNSGSSSRNSTPPCARLTSPGRGYDPPPINPASEIVWCGARNGRRATNDSPSGSTPATEWILIVSSASSRPILGRIVGRRRASIVFPEPGGPIIRVVLFQDPYPESQPVKAKAQQETKRPTAYSYLRFSTPEQAAGDSRRRQTELAERYAKEHDLELDDQLTFHDLGVSAFSGANLSGQLGAFLSAVQSKLVKQGSYLLVENLDRVSRQGFWQALPTIQAIVNAGIVLVTLTDERRYDLAAVEHDPMAIMALCFGLIRAGEESSLKARRVGEAWAAKRAKAATTPMTAKVPGWCVLDRASGKIKLIPERAAVVRQIFKLTLKGVGQDSIAKQLNKKHVPTFGRAKVWQRSYIAKITSNPAVIGIFHPHLKQGGKRKPLDPVTGYYPPVVDK